MKFGKSLSNQIEETLPEWRDKFLSYKELKKKLKLIDPKDKDKDKEGDDRRPVKRQRISTMADQGMMMTKEEVDFISLLERELDKFNTFFVEKEEEYIIRLKELQDRVAKANTLNEEMLKIRKEIVDFHGEMVLLENYSSLNYTGLVKILKKYDKRTGALIRLPFIQKVLQQPFFTTDLLYKLVKECERILDLLILSTNTKEPSTTVDDAGQDQERNCSTSDATTANNNGLLINELAEIKYMESLYLKSTISALRALKQIRSRSSTVSEFSLPPLQLKEAEETWNKIQLPEQVAK